MRASLILTLLLVTGCAGLPTYVEPTKNEPVAVLKVQHKFNAPFLGYSTFVNVHTEEQTCGKSFGSKSAARLVVLDDNNPLISELNSDGVKLSIGSKYSFMIMSVAGMNNCTIYTSFMPKANEHYEMNIFGTLGGYDTNCKAELYRIDEASNSSIPVKFQYYGECREPSE